MDLKLYVLCILMFICGQLLHLLIVKIPSLRTRFQKANTKFLFKEYWKSDWHLITGLTVLAIMLLIGSDELFHYSPFIMEHVKWFFGFIGGFGQSVVLSKWSRYEKLFNNIIDQKTNIADNITK